MKCKSTYCECSDAARTACDGRLTHAEMRALYADPVPPAGGKPDPIIAVLKGHLADGMNPMFSGGDLKHLIGLLEVGTRLQAEVEQWKLAHRLAMQDNIKLQSELTKAREALREIICACGDERSHGYISMLAEDALSNQSELANKGQV